MTGSARPLRREQALQHNAGTYWTGQSLRYTVTAARFATGTITVEGMPLDGDTVVIGDKTYTWRTTLSTPAVCQ